MSGLSFDPPRLCRCGSGHLRHALYDARAIFVAYVCARCEATVRGRFRPEIFTDPNYDTDEDVED